MADPLTFASRRDSVASSASTTSSRTNNTDKTDQSYWRQQRSGGAGKAGGGGRPARAQQTASLHRHTDVHEHAANPIAAGSLHAGRSVRPEAPARASVSVC